MSAHAPSAVPLKICTVCGLDVSKQKRTKDAEGNYYCDPCWALKRERQQQVEASSAAPDAADDELPFCEACEGRFTPGNLRDHKGQILCVDCIEELSQNRRVIPYRSAGKEVPEHVRKIIATNPLILLAFAAGAVSCVVPPLVLVVISI